MKQPIQSRKPKGAIDYLALGLTTFGVGYFPFAPGTIGSALGVMIYLFAEWAESAARGISVNQLSPESFGAFKVAINSAALLIFCIVGIWAAGRSTELLGDADPSAAIVDEIIGQLITFLFVPFSISWEFILAGFLLFRLFDIWKPYPIDSLQSLPGGIGVCADDILAGVYAGISLAIIYALFLVI
ncbi:MAG: phosphatidylglycerophosphatase A [Pyrinomonadaceae bacterium]|jgi:phosphatidylglycerophosphatase A